MRTRSIAFAGGAAVVCAILVGASRLAADSRPPSKELPQGFTHDYLLIESTNGAVTVLQSPQIRGLNDRTFVVGSTVHLVGVTDDELFKSTVQWVCLEDVRRMGELGSPGALSEVQEIAAMRRINEERRRDAQRAK